MSVPNRRNRIKKLVAVGALLTIGVLAGFAYWALPSATGYTAHYLCTQSLVANRDAARVFAREVKPTHVIFNLVNYKIDQTTATVSAFGWGGMRTKVALYRPKLGCTVMVDTDADKLHKQAAEVFQTKPLEAASDSDNALPQALNDPLATPAFHAILDKAMREPDANSLRNTHAVVVLHQGKIIAERYADGVRPETPLLGWSMTKTVTGLLAGILVQDGKLKLEQDKLMPEWSAANDERSKITLKHLLQWNSGIGFHEAKKPGSDTTKMLYESADMARYYASLPLENAPGTIINYQSGGSVVLAKVMAQAISNRPLDLIPFAQKRLFEPLGMRNVMLEPDVAGHLAAGSYMLASARDWARLGQLLLQQGQWQGKQVVAADWIKFMATPQLQLKDGEHGAHLWLNASVDGKKRFKSLPDDLMVLEGWNHQAIVVIPSRQLVITRLGACVDGNWNTEGFVAALLSTMPS